jgi:exodeoxyribonuclease V gamma subunit
MTFTLIPHTSLEQAVSVLAAHLDRHQAGDPLATTTVLVQGSVIGRWLATELAARSRHGISAGLDLRPVGAFCRSLVAPAAGPDPYAVEALIWSVDAALADGGWLAGVIDGDGLRQAVAALDRAGRHALAVQLAGILDRYQFERPQWIAAWSAGQRVAEAAGTPWLLALWARIRSAAGSLEPISSRLDALTRSLRSGSAPAPRLPGDIWILAPSSLPPLFTRLLAALGEQGGIEVRILHLIPARHESMWTALENEGEHYDPETTPMDVALAGAHPLLGSYARQAHDLAVLLAETGDGRSRTVDLDRILGREQVGEPSLLAQLQEQIHQARAGKLNARGRDDRSLTVHRCHSQLREVEALRDALVEALTAADAAHPEAAIRPDQVLVAVTDLETYAPLLQAVLGEDRGDGISFGVRVVGESAAADPLVTALLAILALPGSEAPLEAVLAPFDAPAIRRRFALDEEALEILRHRLIAAGVSWGLDAAQRRRVTGYGSAEGTWRSGVDRLLHGLISGHDGVLGLPGAPRRFAAGAQLLGDAPALGGLAVYLEIVLRFSAATGDGTVVMATAEWRPLLFGLLADCADAQTGTEVRALQLLRSAIAAIPRDAAAPDLRTIRKHIERMLAQDASASSWSRGGIIVAPLAALRHAPHQLIAVLGLDSSFPGSRIGSAFDPAAGRRRRGDLSQRLDGRQLFLDLLLAARSRLHLSWTGFSASDGSAREPSAVIEDLLRFLDGQLQAGRDGPGGRQAVLVQHHLHGSNAAYFDGSQAGMPRSFDALACSAAIARRSRDGGGGVPTVARFLTGPASMPPPALLSPEELIAWTCDPAREFAEHVLGLNFHQLGASPEHEPIALDALDSWHLRQQLLDGLLTGRAPDEERLRQDGLLPHGAVGANALAAISAEAAAIIGLIDAALGGLGVARPEVLAAVRSVACALPGAGMPRAIAGTIPRCHGRVALRIHEGAVRARHLLAGWTLHQLLHADSRAHGREDGVTTLIIGAPARPKAGGMPCHGSCSFRPEDASAEHWAAIIQALRASWHWPAPLFPELANACSDWRNPGHLDQDALAQHLEAWRAGADEGDDVSVRSELATPTAWTRLLWRGVEDPTSGSAPAGATAADGSARDAAPDWAWFLDRLWYPATAAARFPSSAQEGSP